MLILHVDDFAAYQVAILQQKDIMISPISILQVSKCKGLFGLSTTWPVSCQRLLLNARTTHSHSVRPWIHQRPHLGGSVHLMLFEAPNESFDPPNGQGRTSALTGEASLAQTAPAPYLGHVALPALNK